MCRTKNAKIYFPKNKIVSSLSFFFQPYFFFDTWKFVYPKHVEQKFLKMNNGHLEEDDAEVGDSSADADHEQDHIDC